jgi:hypothetical protein
MFESHRHLQHSSFRHAVEFFAGRPDRLIQLERHVAGSVWLVIKDRLPSIVSDFAEASYLYPFWQNYPPDERGRGPVGDQFPWIEVGEQVIGSHLLMGLAGAFELSHPGLPTGPDLRAVVTGADIQSVISISSSCWLFVDIKSVGPRDDQDHAVMSHNQVSGSGDWDKERDGVSNRVITAQGKYRAHGFFAAMPPVYISSDGAVLPVVTTVVKPVYGMLKDPLSGQPSGQPLTRIDIAVIPNGILLERNPHYLGKYPGLFFPGKDDKGKNPLKVRARVDFAKLRAIAPWRVKKIEVRNS